MRISRRLKKLAYSVATAASLAAAGLVVAWGVRPIAAPWDEVHARHAHPQTMTAAASGVPLGPSRDDFAQLWDRPLRRELYDPPPPKPLVKQLPPLRVELLGTILEAANSMAIVRSEQGRIEYKRAGDSVGPADSPAQLVEIGADSIVVVRADERVTLKVSESRRR
jgi:hypothetical protein